MLHLVECSGIAHAPIAAAERLIALRLEFANSLSSSEELALDYGFLEDSLKWDEVVRQTWNDGCDQEDNVDFVRDFVEARILPLAEAQEIERSDAIDRVREVLFQ